MAESKDIMNALYKKYGLSKDDVHIHKHYKIITRAGINKIEARANIDMDYEVIRAERDDVALLCTGTMLDAEGNKIKSVKTFGEATQDRIEIVDGQVIKTYKGNVRQSDPYLFAMAEKRGKSRAVLVLAGFYELGFYGEDEADTFSKVVDQSRADREAEDATPVERSSTNSLIKKVVTK